MHDYCDYTNDDFKSIVSNKNNNNTTKETIITMEDFNTTTPSS